MNELEIDELLSAANPLDAGAVALLATAAVLDELRDGIVKLAVAPEAAKPSSATRSRLGRRARPLVVGAVSAAAVVAASLVIVKPLSDDGDQSVWAADALAVAEAVPRYLVTANGWGVTRVDEFSVDVGEMSFEGPDGVHLDLFWATGFYGSYEDWAGEWSRDPYTLLDNTTIAGGTAQLTTESVVMEADVANEDGDVVLAAGERVDKFVAIWSVDDYVLRAESDEFGDVDAFVAVTASIESVSADEWLSAMPASVVQPVDQEAVLAAMLADVAVPEGFDSSDLAGQAGATDRRQLGVRVVAALRCAWLNEWSTATTVGDHARADAAIEATAASRQWDILAETNEKRLDLPFWKWADEMSNGDASGLVSDYLENNCRGDS